MSLGHNELTLSYMYPGNISMEQIMGIISWPIVKPSGVQTGSFWDIWVNIITMASDALAPSVARPSETMVLTQDKWVPRGLLRNKFETWQKIQIHWFLKELTHANKNMLIDGYQQDNFVRCTYMYPKANINQTDHGHFYNLLLRLIC